MGVKKTFIHENKANDRNSKNISFRVVDSVLLVNPDELRVGKVQRSFIS